MESACDFLDNQAAREHIDHIRRRLETLANKTPDDQEILLQFDELTNEIGGREHGCEIATLTIKSGAKNALSGKMISQLTDRIDQVYDWLHSGPDHFRPRALLLQGHGGTFCSGSDLVGVRQCANQLAGLELAQVMQYNMMRLQCLPIISVALVEGYALGGGAELALATDFRLMSSSAKIGFVHSRVGVCCGWGGGTRLVELAGRSRALELLASGRLIKADEALQIGLADALADGREPALEFAAEHSIGSMRTSRALKSMVNGARCLPFKMALRLERYMFASTWGGEAHLRALDASIKHRQ